MDFEFGIKQRIVFGPGKVGQIGALAADYGKRALLVADPFCAASGLAGKVMDNMKAAGIAVELFDGVVPNPTTTSIEEAVALARRQGSEMVVGLGGGSSIDTAKAVAVGAAHPRPLWDYAIGNAEVTSATLPVVAITTTAGTGSHCTCFSVITNPETHQKPGMGSPHILPKTAVVDPELTLSMPKGLTAICGFDVFSHAVEAYTSKAASPLSDMFAEKAIRLAVEYLPICYENGADLKAREMMALADTCSGIAITHAVVSLGHVVAHVIGGHYPDIAHGDALFTIYPEILAFNAQAPETRGKHAFVAKSMGGDIANIRAAFDSFFARFAFERKLRSKHPDKAAIAKIAEETFTYMKGIADLNPMPAAANDVRGILERSLG